MGGPLVDSSAEVVGSSLCLCRTTCEKTGFEHSSCAWSEDENFEAGIAFGQQDLVVGEIGTALAEVNDDDDDEGTDPDEDSDDSVTSPESDSTDDLVDIDTELVSSSPFITSNAFESSIGKSEDGDSSRNGTPILVSAMKGSRAKRGIVTRLSVSWAPDVYDPPVTSDSHTVKAPQRSSRKVHYKYKPPKGSSSSRSSNGSKKDKKHTRHSSGSSSGSSSSSRDKNPSHRSTNGGSSSTDAGSPQRHRTYGSGSTSSRTNTTVPRCYEELSPWVPAKSAPLEEAVPMPVLKAVEQIKRSTNCCKEQPLSMLSRQFVAARYKGMFSLWSQNQLAS